MSYLVDSHCHLESLSLEGKAAKSIDEIIERARRCGVSHFLSVACTSKEFEKNLSIAQKYNNIFLACGIHPLNLEEEPDWSDEELKKNLLSSDKVIAVGETGLDYHYAPETKNLQISSFVRHIGVALEVKKPIVIHAREAKNDTLSILKSENARDAGGVIHCFTDSVDMARVCLDLGFYISFTGIATFKPSDNVREVVKYVPLDRMMVETDCPYLAPVPVRGIENEPAFVRYTLKYLADFKGVSEKELARITSENFENLYKLKLSDYETPPKGCEISSYKIENIIDRSFS
ncbi:TatD DNase family protein [Succinivibrio dextrinosolvens]|uniref:TatD family hydrolase n=1 Tax=Succinivibrio dextrinosolvens TaxID=83771 RepID=UPI0008EEBE31|nr:TatD family hydrolase [Succinivibrio dextrinosolvens]SFS85540.1 TatD DNase family protein [Succinivibrio dextrinosolvens]